MIIQSAIIRKYDQMDWDRFVRFQSTAEPVCRIEDVYLFEALARDPQNHSDMSECNLWVAEAGGEIIGSCRVVAEPAIGRALVGMLLAPGAMERGIAADLLGSALGQAKKLQAARLHVDPKETDANARRLFDDLGFTPVRRYADMVMELESVSIPARLPEGLSLRVLKPGQEAEFTALQNHVFQDSWGYCPNTEREITRRLQRRGYGHEGVMLIYMDDRPAGYCWTAIVHPPALKTGSTIGRIHMMGVVPEFRGQGLGKPVLWSGVKHLADRGVQTVELTTDAENEAARALYENAGFQYRNTRIWYEKQLQ